MTPLFVHPSIALDFFDLTYFKRNDSHVSYFVDVNVVKFGSNYCVADDYKVVKTGEVDYADDTPNLALVDSFD